MFLIFFFFHFYETLKNKTFFCWNDEQKNVKIEFRIIIFNAFEKYAIYNSAVCA